MADFEAHDLTEGLNGFLGFRLIDWREGFAQIAVDLQDQHKNRQGGLHGGVTASLIDAATGFCGVYEADPEKRRGNVTVSLNVNFQANSFSCIFKFVISFLKYCKLSM